MAHMLLGSRKCTVPMPLRSAEVCPARSQGTAGFLVSGRRVSAIDRIESESVCVCVCARACVHLCIHV